MKTGSLAYYMQSLGNEQRRDLRQRKEGDMDMERNLRYRKLISFIAIAFILLPFALCLVNDTQAETMKYIYDDVNRVISCD